MCPFIVEFELLNKKKKSFLEPPDWKKKMDSKKSIKGSNLKRRMHLLIEYHDRGKKNAIVSLFLLTSCLEFKKKKKSL